MARVIVAGIGFTVDFVMRRVADLGRGEVRHVILVGLRTRDEQAWRRVREAYSLLSTFLQGLGIPSELVEAHTGTGLVRTARDALARAASLAGPDGEVELYATGGPRLLLVALLVAALTSTPQVRDKVRVVAYGEGFPDKLEVHIGKLAKLLRLDPESEAILREIARLGEARARDLLEVLDMRRSTLYLKLNKLREEGLVIADSGKWRIHPDLDGIL